MHYGKQLMIGSILLGGIFMGLATMARHYSSYEWVYDDLEVVTYTDVTQIRREKITLTPRRESYDPEMKWLERWP